MFKSTALSALALAAITFTSVPATATETTVKCVGTDRHMVTVLAPKMGSDGRYLGNLEPDVMAAQCKNEPGAAVFILEMPGAPRFTSMEEVKRFLVYISTHGATIANGRAGS